MDSYCQNCGTKLEGAKFCPNCGQPVNQTEQNIQPVQITEQQPIQPPEQGAKNKTRTVIEQPWFWAVSIAVIVFLVVILIVCVPKNSNSSSSKNYNQSQSSSKSSSSVKKNKDYYTVGESCELNGISAKISSCEIYNFDYLEPADGKMFIKVHAKLTNLNTEDESLGKANFQCYANNTVVNDMYVYDDNSLTAFDNVSYGRSVEGDIYYEVPLGADIELEFSPNWVYSKEKGLFKLDY